MTQLTHDMLCQALKAKDSFEIFTRYFDKYSFDLESLKPTHNQKDEFGDISFLHMLLLNYHDLSTEEIINIMNFFCEKGMDLLEVIPSNINFHGSTSLELVIRYGDLALLQYFIESTEWKKELKNLDSKAMKEIFIFTAINGDIEMLEYLAPKLTLEQIYANCSDYGHALMGATIVDNLEKIQYLHQNFNFDIQYQNEQGMNMLMLSTINSHDGTAIKYWLEHEKFDLNQTNADNENVLMLSIRNMYTINAYCQFVTHHPFDMNHENIFKQDIVDIIRETQNWDIFLELLENNRFDFKKTYYGDSGYNVLMVVSNNAPVEVVQALVNQIPFDISFTTKPIKENKNLATNALLEAALCKNEEIVEYYLNHGYFMDVENLTLAKNHAKELFSTKEDGTSVIKQEKKKRDRCLAIIEPYLHIALEKEKLEKITSNNNFNILKHSKI